MLIANAYRIPNKYNFQKKRRRKKYFKIRYLRKDLDKYNSQEERRKNISGYNIQQKFLRDTSYFIYLLLNEKMINLRNRSVIRFLGTSNDFVIQQ